MTETQEQKLNARVLSQSQYMQSAPEFEGQKLDRDTGLAVKFIDSAHFRRLFY